MWTCLCSSELQFTPVDYKDTPWTHGDMVWSPLERGRERDGWQNHSKVKTNNPRQNTNTFVRGRNSWECSSGERPHARPTMRTNLSATPFRGSSSAKLDWHVHGGFCKEISIGMTMNMKYTDFYNSLTLAPRAAPTKLACWRLTHSLTHGNKTNILPVAVGLAAASDRPGSGHSGGRAQLRAQLRAPRHATPQWVTLHESPPIPSRRPPLSPLPQPKPCHRTPDEH